MLLYHMTCICTSVLSDTWLLVSVLTSHYDGCPAGHGIVYLLAIILSMVSGLHTLYTCMKQLKGIEKQDLLLIVFRGLASNVVMLGYWLYGLNQNNCAIVEDMKSIFGKVNFCITCLLVFLRSMEIMLEWMQEDQCDLGTVNHRGSKKSSGDNGGDMTQPKRKVKRSMSVTEIIIHSKTFPSERGH